jgi:CheY-like chemotaxis protein
MEKDLDMGTKKQIGKLLVDAGIISDKTLERALKIQKESGKRLGALLGEMGIVSEIEVIEALADQCKLRTVKNFANMKFSKDLLGLVPVRLALGKTIFPLIHNVSELAIATLDPYDSDTISRLAKTTGMRIRLALSTRKDIIEAIEKHYLNGEKVTDLKQRILLIDDSQVFVKVLTAALTKEGFEVLVAGDGVEGLKLSLSEYPDLIICDQFMPRMDGYKFMLTLKKYHDHSEIPIILITSKASKEEEDKALNAGFSDFVGKPAIPAKVIERIKRVLVTDVN